MGANSMGLRFPAVPGLALLLTTACARTPTDGPTAPVASVQIAPATGASSASVAALAGPLPALDLPRVTRAAAGRVEGTIVTVEGEQVLVGDINVGADDLVLVSTLQARAESWTGQHAGAPAVLGLRLARTTPASLVKRIFRGAAQAGYRKAAIAVKSARAEAHLDIDMILTPRPVDGEPAKDLPLLLLRLDAGSMVTLIWRQGDTIVSALDVPWSGAFEQGLVAAHVVTGWKAGGQHRDSSDPRRDLASVEASDDADLAAIVAAYDAILAMTRSFAGTPGPAFALAFGSPPVVNTGPTFGPSPRPTSITSSGPSIRMGQTTAKGNLPPEVIQRIVRQSFGRFRLCYENALRRDRALVGEIVVRFTIGADGAIGAVAEHSSTLRDATMRQCVVTAFKTLSFPSPLDSRPVDVLYPLQFAPKPTP